MQRVLSIQTARGFGESSEFVTKRSCISFLFAIGFLCLLGGFMMGRFAAQRTIIVKAERARLQLANNGLEMTEHLQYRILEFLQNNNINNSNNSSKNQINISTTEEIFSDLKFINQVFKYKSCTIAKVYGSKESDRYVVISLIKKGIPVMIELVKSLNKIYEEQEWKPRRTIIFCACKNYSKDCFNELPNYMQSRIVAFITVPDNSADSYNLLSPEKDCLLVSGSNIAQAAVLEAANSMRKFNSKSLNLCNETITISHINLNIPHAIISFVDKKSSLIGLDKEILAQIVGLSIWRLSESIILPWNPNNLNNTIFKNLKIGFKLNLNNLMDKVIGYSEKLNTIETANTLNVRIANDVLLDLDKNFLCFDNQQQSAEKIEECYKNINDILQEL